MNVALARPLASYYAQHYAQALVIPAGGMEPTLLVGDSIMVDRTADRDRSPQRHDIVVLLHPEDEQRVTVAENRQADPLS
jgi:signal peptidase I